MKSRMSSWLYTLCLPEKKTAKKLVNVINPRPPISNITSRIPCPRGVNVEAMSTLVRPQMHTAEVETKRLSRKEMPV